MTAPNQPFLPFGLRSARLYRLNASGTPDATYNPALSDSLLVDGNLAIDAVPEKFKTTQDAVYTVGGIPATKSAATALTFTAAHVITASKFGVILVQINAAGTISTKVPSSPQAYNDAPTALAALPDADTDNVALGYIAIENNAGDWTANTDDLTNGSDLTSATFNDADLTVLAYEGTQIKGSVAFEVTFPEPRKITGLGEDSVTAVAYLPPNESVSAKLNVEADDPALADITTGDKIRTLGDSTLMVAASSNQGFEPNVGMILSQACRGLTTGGQFWRNYILPSAMVVKQDGGMNAEKSMTVYNIAPNVVSNHLWGETMTDAVEGAVSSQLVKVWSNHPLIQTSFYGNGVDTEFPFPANTPSAASYATSTVVFVDGVKQTAGYTVTATKVTFTVAPAKGKWIDVYRELA
jgi:hypothetical protein